MATKSVSTPSERALATGGVTAGRARRPINTDMLIAFVVLLPSIIAVAIFIYTAIGWTFYISTVKWNSQIIDYTFVGLRNWTRLFSDNRFYTDLRNLVYYAIGFMTQCILFGFIIASLLDQKIKGETIFRTIIIFPFAVSGIVTGVAWRWLHAADDRVSTCSLPRSVWRIFSPSGTRTPIMACGR